ncbi:type IVB secretion system protein IcmH/DotU [Zestomonas carbonaria]|uniref:Type IV / VI secretion system DotU domain-containing protein n=1 Tax=Zestomonas carbonaria TaxID=2762745 RepID=A0A7U7ERF8_9GAMM|nr:type IVB secretion system protein IcmH/DotU [Pseudomonas carbonaria]CAD5109357.1 hypothetical protein PSEWESI4_03654 [Pseudomonas carbonaria]
MSSTETASRRTDYQRTTPASVVTQKQDIMFEGIQHIDHDEDLDFQLRGHGYNPMVDGALPLFGLVIRLRGMEKYEDVGGLYEMVRKQIAALDEEINQHNYDTATQLAFRYALCTFVDEAVMGTPWGSKSMWAQRSLLSAYHDETWGGEKFFTILSRMLMEPEKYRDVLEFKYLCLCLGFRGKYGLQHDNNDKSLQALIDKLHRTLRELRGDSPEQLTDASANVTSRRYRIGRQLPWWAPWIAAAALLACVYILYAMSLGNTTEQVLQSLDEILRH